MKILSLKAINGPNVFHDKPIMSLKVDLENWTDIPSTEITGFTENLLSLLPGLKNHTCSPGHVGGFVERLRRGTYMAHIIEHIALELSQLVGIGVSYGKTRYAGSPGIYHIVTRCLNESGMQMCFRLAMELAESATRHAVFDLDIPLKKIKIAIARTALGPSTKALIDAAEKRHIPWRRLGGQSLIQLGQGKHSRRIQTAVTNNTSLIATDLAKDKQLTKSLLESYFLPVPQGETVSTIVQLKQIVEDFGTPFVIKPVDGNHGKGVFLNLETYDDALMAFAEAKNYSDDIVIEEMCSGRDYRILLVDGKLVAAAERQPPYVTGDGSSTIQELITEINKDPRRGEGHCAVLTRIETDIITHSLLAKRGLTVDSVLPRGQKVNLRENANLSSGGTASDVTECVHPDIRMICERAARVVGLDICGIDLVCNDISQPADESVKIIEVNAGPGLRMHLAPTSGKSQPVAEKIIEMVYPNEQSGRIPVFSVTGTNGKTSVTRMLHNIYAHTAKCAGMTTTDGIWIGNEKVYSGDTTGPQSAQIILSDPKVDVAILEVARGGLLRGGLAYDWSDVSIITNVAADHIGQDGIESVDDVVWIKMLVAERVREGGTLVLNADDDNSLAMRDHPRVKRRSKKIFLYSTNFENQALARHISDEGNAAWIEDDWVTVQFHGQITRLIKVQDIPSTLGGICEFQVSNVLAAVSAALAGGVFAQQIVESLREMEPENHNLGRASLYRIAGKYVMLDYGHNEPAFAAMGKVVRHLQGYHKTAIVAVPGDRTDELIENAAEEIAEHFDQVIVRYDKDLRGRLPGEVASMICKKIATLNKPVNCLRIPNEVAALKYALTHSPRDSFIVLFYEHLDLVQNALLEFDPVPVHEIPPLSADISKRIQVIRGAAIGAINAQTH